MKNYIKKSNKLLTAIVVSLALAAGSASAVLGVQSGALTGENEVTSMVISVVTPLNLDFVLDPLELESGGGNQVVPKDFFFINRTGAPVKVSLNVALALNNGASLVDDPSVLAKDDVSVTDKNIYFGIMGADRLESGGLDFDTADGPDEESDETEPGENEGVGFDAASGHNARGIYDPAGDTLVPFDTTSRMISMEFVLAPASKSSPDSGYDTLAANNKGIAAFQFYAEMNTYAKWEPGDLQITASYEITPLRTSTYEGFFTEDMFTLGGWGTQLRQ